MEIEEKYIKAVLTMYVILDDKLRPDAEDEVENVVNSLTMDNHTATCLADSINSVVKKTGKDGEEKPAMGRITVGRFIGAFGNTRGHISPANLQVIAEYLGFKSLEEMLNKGSLKAHILSKAQFLKPEIVKSKYLKNNELHYEDTLDYLLPMNIPAGCFVDIHYGNKGKHIKFRKLKDTGDVFVIVESDSALIKKGWHITIPFFILNNNLVGTNVCMNGIKISSLYKSSGTVRSIKLPML